MQGTFQAERLKLARQRRGLNKTQLAGMVGVKPPTITAYERAEREPPTAEMIQRLANALDFPVGFFYAELGDLVPLDAASFRSLSRMTASQRDAALASGTLCAQLNRWISERFRLPDPDLPDYDVTVITPTGAAAHIRAGWGLGHAPIGNVLQTLEAHGVRVYALAAECREVDAFSFWCDETNTPFIIVGTHKTPERQVFDLAHELGHLVLHRDHGAPRGRQEEREADEFASNFLMPKEDLAMAAPRSPSFRELVRAKHRWKVSVAALAYRMHSLGLIKDWNYHKLCVELAKMGRDTEVDSLPREQSQVLPKVFTALRAENVTRSDVATALHVHPADLEALLGRLVPSAVDGGREGAPQRGRADLRLVN